MTYDSTSTLGSRRTITAFFATRDDAEDAIDDLVEDGFSRDEISLVAGNEPASTTVAPSEGGFWEGLKDLFLPNEDRHVYAEGLRRGGYLVSLTTTAENYERALDILDDEGTIDLGERETEWRSEGWTGYTGADYTGTTAGTTATPSAAIPPVATTAESRAVDSRDDVIEVAEEELRVGKREVSQGRVRVRSYVIETPVSEQVNLREEHVNVERRSVDRPLAAGDALFQDRTIEVEQRAEEAVISKDARVTEELVVNKDVGERSETISDTVRRTEVEVEDDRGEIIGGTTKRPL